MHDGKNFGRGRGFFKAPPVTGQYSIQSATKAQGAARLIYGDSFVKRHENTSSHISPRNSEGHPIQQVGVFSPRRVSTDIHTVSVHRDQILRERHRLYLDNMARKAYARISAEMPKGGSPRLGSQSGLSPADTSNKYMGGAFKFTKS